MRSGYHLDRLVTVYGKLSTDAGLTHDEQFWLAELLRDIGGDIDVRERFHRTVRGAPPDHDRKFWCAVWIAIRDDDVRITDAKDAAKEHWRMTADQVRIAWRDHRADAVALLGSRDDRQALARVIEYPRRRVQESR